MDISTIVDSFITTRFGHKQADIDEVFYEALLSSLVTKVQARLNKEIFASFANDPEMQKDLVVAILEKLHKGSEVTKPVDEHRSDDEKVPANTANQINDGPVVTSVASPSSSPVKEPESVPVSAVKVEPENNSNGVITGVLEPEDFNDELSELIPDDGIMGKNNKFPKEVQSHPLVLLRIPLFVAGRHNHKSTDLTDHESGKDIISRFSAQGYEGFDTVHIEGPTMNSLHFIVWNAIVRCFRETSKAELVKGEGTIVIPFTKFMDYSGVSAKNKRMKQREKIIEAMRDIKKQVIVIRNKKLLQAERYEQDPDVEVSAEVEEEGGLKEAVYDLISSYIIDQEKDTVQVSVSRTFFVMFSTYLIPIDQNILLKYKSELLRIVLLFINSLPASGNRHLTLKRIIERAKPQKETIRARDYHEVLELMLELKKTERVSFELIEAEDVDKIVFKNFSHTLQRTQNSEIQQPSLARRPKRTKSETDLQFLVRLKKWLNGIYLKIQKYSQDSGDQKLTFIRFNRIKSLCEDAALTETKDAREFFQKIYDLRK